MDTNTAEESAKRSSVVALFPTPPHPSFPSIATFSEIWFSGGPNICCDVVSNIPNPSHCWALDRGVNTILVHPSNQGSFCGRGRCVPTRERPSLRLGIFAYDGLMAVCCQYNPWISIQPKIIVGRGVPTRVPPNLRPGIFAYGALMAVWGPLCWLCPTPRMKDIVVPWEGVSIQSMDIHGTKGHFAVCGDGSRHRKAQISR